MFPYRVKARRTYYIHKNSMGNLNSTRSILLNYFLILFKAVMVQSLTLVYSEWCILNSSIIILANLNWTTLTLFFFTCKWFSPLCHLRVTGKITRLSIKLQNKETLTKVWFMLIMELINVNDKFLYWTHRWSNISVSIATGLYAFW